jgi:tetratricopeptide (TPR) repeat protein
MTPLRQAEWARLVKAFAEARRCEAWPEAQAVARAAVAAFPERSHSHHIGAQALIGLGRRTEAQQLLADALARLGEEPSLLDLAWRNEKALGQSVGAIALIERLLAIRPLDAGLLINRARLELLLYQSGQALETLTRASEAGGDRVVILRLSAAAAEQSGRIEAARKFWREIEQLGAGSPEELTAVAVRLGRAVDVSHRYARDTGSLDALMDLQSSRKERVAMSLPAQDACAWRHSPSKSLLMVFGGVLAMMGAVRPGLPEGLPDGHALNVLSLVDPTRRFLLDGAPSFGKSYAETIGALRRLIDCWGIERVYVLGYSSGAHSALRYGLDLDARRMTMMSGWMSLPEESTHPLLGSLASQIGHAYEDPRALIAGADRVVEIELAYGAANASDAWQARRLADLPGVSLHPLAGVTTHSLGLEPAHSGLIQRLLRDAN